MADFIHIGDTIDYTPGGAITAGDVVVQGTLVGVATQDIAANALGALRVKGVFEFAKGILSGDALTVGLKVYWDDTNDVVTTTAGANQYVGKVVRAATAATATVWVRLEQ